MVQVELGPNERPFLDYTVLEPVLSEQEPFELLREGQFGNQSDLRRVLTFEKLSGDLTNIFYSMESSNTDFYPHQFKPVLRFIESPVSRMLIADEVGLGKTIESTYIWKEVQARYGARRLLVVCPAMLREKWVSDLKKRFNIRAEIVNIHQLYQRLSDIAQDRSEEPFVYIVSLQSINAPSGYAESSDSSTRVKLAKLLDRHPATPAHALIDHVIIDEAHYLRNPSTGYNRVAQLLRDAARHLTLLTATPIQLNDNNLFQLMRIIDPDEFHDTQVFSSIIDANRHIVRAQRALWKQPADREDAADALGEATQTEYFRNDPALELLRHRLREKDFSNEDRVEALRRLESRSLLSQYMTRSRKREVLKNRVERFPIVRRMSFTPEEKAVYDRVTSRIRQRALGQSGVHLFSLLARQRQMASSIVGALESWDEKGISDELLWDDLGDIGLSFLGSQENLSDEAEIEDSEAAFGESFNIRALEQNDTKYSEFSTFLKEELAKNTREKFVVFAFYRGTLKYLHRRLQAEGVDAILLMGAGEVSKDEVVARFQSEDGPSVLLSSEVGSEGIDLQFCRYLVNYDLPWNPMKVEQRIGRLDRLGQKAERISIVNLYVENTVEDRILERLYSRVNVFRESIGDLEDILGEITEQILPDLLNPNLTDEERERNAKDAELAIANTQQQRKELEEEAVNLIGFSDYILENIQDSRDRGHWLSGGEILAFIDDFFAKNFPGCRIEARPKDHSAQIQLSREAQLELSQFIERTTPATKTQLHRSGRMTHCVFDPRTMQSVPENGEFMDPSHPMILWIKDRYRNNSQQIYKVSAVRLSPDETSLEPGDYVYCVQKWMLKGLRSETELAFLSMRMGDTEFLSAKDSEALVYKASRYGAPIANAANVLGSMEDFALIGQHCEDTLYNRFGDRREVFDAENSVRCNQQETSTRKYAERRIADFAGRIDRYKADGRKNLIPMNQAQLENEERERDEKLARIQKNRTIEPSTFTLAMGVVRVEVPHD